MRQVLWAFLIVGSGDCRDSCGRRRGAAAHLQQCGLRRRACSRRRRGIGGHAGERSGARSPRPYAAGRRRREANRRHHRDRVRVPRGRGTVFSDQRCGSGATRRDVHAPSRMDPQDTSILGQRISEPDYPRADSGYAEAFALTASQCADIERTRDATNARTREGYSGAEGLSSCARACVSSATEYYALHCRHFH